MGVFCLHCDVTQVEMLMDKMTYQRVFHVMFSHVRQLPSSPLVFMTICTQLNKMYNKDLVVLSQFKAET